MSTSVKTGARRVTFLDITNKGNVNTGSQWVRIPDDPNTLRYNRTSQIPDLTPQSVIGHRAHTAASWEMHSLSGTITGVSSPKFISGDASEIKNSNVFLLA